jgi:ATP-dependent DNA helicase PIF1
MESTLSELQNIAFTKYLEGKNIFITGPGGTGKTQLIKHIYNHALQNYKEIQVCAMTGCAAVLLKCKAKTLHSWAGIGIANGSIESIVEKVCKASFKKKNWKEINILIVDEVSMMSKKLFILLDKLGKKIRKNDKPFGGIQLIFSGDFFQLGPVGNEDEPDTCSYCFECEQWFETFSLDNHIEFTQIFRQTDNIFTDILNSIRKGIIEAEHINILNTQVNKKKPTDLIIKPTKLYPRRNTVDFINDKKMSKLEGEEYEFTYKFIYDLPLTEKEKFKRNNYSSEQIDNELNYIRNNLLCNDVIKLKIGAQVMCIVNKELPTGEMLCNGSQGIIIGFDEDGFPNIKFNMGLELVVKNHLWCSENIPGIGVSQIPLILAWAITIHKIQGNTLEHAEIDVGSSIFDNGQTYVALSRVKSLDGLYLKAFDHKKIKVDEKVIKFYEKLQI